MEHNEKITLLGKATHVGTHLEVGDKTARLKAAASRAVEDAVTKAKRFAKRSRYAAEDVVEDTAHRIKHRPLRSLGLGVMAGLGTGALAVWLASHKE
jgi:uncharacterized protein YggE